MFTIMKLLLCAMKKKKNLETTHLTIKRCILLLLPSSIFCKIAKNTYLQQLFSSLSCSQLSPPLQDLDWGLHFPSPQFICSGIQPEEKRSVNFQYKPQTNGLHFLPEVTWMFLCHFCQTLTCLGFDSIQWQRDLCCILWPWITSWSLFLASFEFSLSSLTCSAYFGTVIQLKPWEDTFKFLSYNLVWHFKTPEQRQPTNKTPNRKQKYFVCHRMFCDWLTSPVFKQQSSPPAIF